ncbi:MAG TPA: AraC family transcriptional regulator [Streptosporangiaceae bacterium]|jgi:AraC-like DNA-binding protein|nr:AraC family transcriptional regulator [Streptosporangiaceae bacterium]
MGLTVVARGTTLRLGVFGHGPGEPVAARDWWPRTCLVFTEYGAWTVRSKHGGGTASATVMVAGAGGTEYECGHPYGVDDRNLCLIFPPGVTPPSAAFVPVFGRIAALRRDLRRHLSARHEHAVEDTATAGGDAAAELDAIGWSLMQAAGSPDAPAAPGARDCRLAGQLRELIDREYANPELDAVSAGAAIGLGRTRMIHVFRAVTGTTPHRYLVERRVAHAAEMLATGDAPVTDVCFASGFGSVARFQAAFKRAWGVPPSQYREATRMTSCRSAEARLASGNGP